MIDQETFDNLLPLAIQWVRSQEALILSRGFPLGQQQLDDARRAGVRDTAKIRLVLVDRIPLPDHPEMAVAARRNQIITDDSRGVTFGYGIMIRADCWGDRELVVHNFVHVAQHERSGSLENAIREYLCDRRQSAKFSPGQLEEEARRIAREICFSTPAPQTLSA